MKLFLTTLALIEKNKQNRQSKYLKYRTSKKWALARKIILKAHFGEKCFELPRRIQFTEEREEKITSEYIVFLIYFKF
jgi:hypothetical protein